MTDKSIADLIPPDPLMAIAWRDCLLWTIKEKDLLAQFRKETGNNWEPSRVPINHMIDEASGADFDFIRQFIIWFNANVWGDINLKAGDE